VSGDEVGGILRVVATPIGNLDDLSPRAAAALRDAGLVLAEDTRRTGRLLAHVGASTPQRSLHEHNEADRIGEAVAALRAGTDVALVTDAGTPTVSDPGYRLVAACVEAGIRVEPVPGPSALLAALVVSGLPTDRVVFEGFLPRRGGTRAERLAQLADEPRTIVLFASPHRVADDLRALADTLGPDRRASLARELTKLHEEVWHGSLGELAERAAAGVRGEVTVVVAGRERDRPADDAMIIAALRDRRAAGRSVRDAASDVSDDLGVGRRRVYTLALDLDREDG
jgi:16S rRNA (cytidine1402-2'-O)-methyltransferase